MSFLRNFAYVPNGWSEKFVLKNFARFTEKHYQWNSTFCKDAALGHLILQSFSKELLFKTILLQNALNLHKGKFTCRKT